jgi:hypothetical protein
LVWKYILFHTFQLQSHLLFCPFYSRQQSGPSYIADQFFALDCFW